MDHYFEDKKTLIKSQRIRIFGRYFNIKVANNRKDPMIFELEFQFKKYNNTSITSPSPLRGHRPPFSAEPPSYEKCLKDK